MSGSIIIFGGNKDDRKEKAFELVSKVFKKVEEWGDLRKNPDIKVVEIPDDKKSIGIGEIRETIRYFSEKPFSGKNKFVVINDANTLTREAQNALLKTLEEPPSYGNVILLTKTLNDLLETVISRCKIKQIIKEKGSKASQEEFDSKDSYKKVLNLSMGKRLDWAGEISKEEREDIVLMLEKWVAEAREMMLDSPSAITLKNTKLINGIKSDLENTNVNMRFALESMVLNLS